MCAEVPHEPSRTNGKNTEMAVDNHSGMIHFGEKGESV